MASEDTQSNRGLLRILDIGERGILLLLFLALCVRLLAAPQSGFYAYLLLLTEGVTVGLILCRRYTSDVTLRPTDWAFSFAGTMLPLMVSTGGTPLAPALAGEGLMVAGLTLSLAAKITLWRSFGLAAANRGVKIGGPYRLVRHPIYLGYFFIYAGFLLMNPNWRNAVFYGAWLACQLARIFAEERQLSRDPTYRDYMARVRFRLLPGVF